MKTIIANWKMNLNVPASVAHFVKLSEVVAADDSIEVVLCPTYLALQTLNIENKVGKFKLGAQNCNAQDNGALTGEVSAEMLVGVATHVIIGHSERRRKYGETDQDINQKVLAALRHNLKPILCIGENQNEPMEDTLRRQLDGGLMGLSADQLDQVIIAYEPVAAIGVGRALSLVDIEHATEIIASQIDYMFGQNLPTKIIYGGSVDEMNSADILSINKINGLLVGGASLDVYKFAKIVEIAKARVE
jgi:triosephosphate isomerase